MKNQNYHRKGFGLKEEIDSVLKSVYESNLIAEIRATGNTIVRNGVTIKLAQAFGFCWGVDRAVSLAYETRLHFPKSQIWITNEIIHNPLVNDNLRSMDIGFVPIADDGLKDFSCVGPNDVVILPAFGASVQEMKLLESKGCQIVDTTCPWVSRVWNRVIKYKQSEYTAIIHGKPNHEETVATSSRAEHYLIVQNLAEAEWVCAYILSGGDEQEFLERFAQSHSEGFFPDRHLIRVGVANQTTMLKGETELIGKLFEKTMLKKYGPESINDHFFSPGDTICDATQERQDAMLELVAEPLDVILVIGGFNSSNTGHLQEIADNKGLRSFHIDGPDCIGPGNLIRHKPLHGSKAVETRNWLPDGPVMVGITSGASTPDQVVAEVIEKTFALRQMQLV